MGLTLEDVRDALTERDGRQPEGQHRRPDQHLHDLDNDQLTRARRPGTTSILAYRNGAPVRVRDIGRRSTGRRTRELAAWQNGKRGVLLLAFKQPGANVIDTVDRDQGRAAAAAGGDPAVGQRHDDRDRTQTIRASVADVQFTLLLTIGAGGDGDLRVPAQRLGHGHPERHRAAGAGRHVRRDVPAGLQPRQPVADGPDHRGRLRRRRRHRHAGEHLSPHRGRA